MKNKIVIVFIFLCFFLDLSAQNNRPIVKDRHIRKLNSDIRKQIKNADWLSDTIDYNIVHIFYVYGSINNITCIFENNFYNKFEVSFRRRGLLFKRRIEGESLICDSLNVVAKYYSNHLWSNGTEYLNFVAAINNYNFIEISTMFLEHDFIALDNEGKIFVILRQSDQCYLVLTREEYVERYFDDTFEDFLENNVPIDYFEKSHLSKKSKSN